MLTVNVGEDCPVFDGLYEFCQLSAGGSVAAAVKLNKQVRDFKCHLRILLLQWILLTKQLL